ncbi:MAG TPA: aquaporin [Gemmatimonadales bacterium]|jgi:aquaporin Z
MSSLARRATAEMLGTAFLVFFGCSAVIMDYFAGYHLFGIAIIHAIILSLAVSMTMGISGGHCNPAVTIGLMTVKRIPPVEAFVYVASQLIGALLASLLVHYAMPDNVGRVVAYGAPTLASNVTFMNAVVLEAIITFLLMSGVMGTIVAWKAPRLAGFGVGLTLIPSIMIAGSLTGAAANPARAFGPAAISGIMTAQAVWWIGPIVGAVLAALLWEHVLLKKDLPPAGFDPLHESLQEADE